MALDILQYLFIGAGVWFWLWGTSHLLGNGSVRQKLHPLSVADTLGSIIIIIGLLFKIPRATPLLILAIICLGLWNTMLSYVLAHCAEED